MLLDTHAHLNFQIFQDDLADIIARQEKVPMGVINVGAQFETSKLAVALTEKYNNFYAAIGLHPIHVFDEVYKAENYEALINSKTVAIGEIGLDFFHLKYLKQPYRIVLLHGWGANCDERFFVWLDEKLTALGHKVLRFNLPNTDQPNQEKWLKEINKQVGYVNDKTLFVGFSLGGATILRYLEQLEEGVKVGGIFLLGTPMDNLGYNELKDFFKTDFAWEKIKASSKKSFVYSSTNDDVVPTDHGKKLAEVLSADLKIIQNAWHFTVDELPELLTDITKTITDLTATLPTTEQLIAKQKEVFKEQLLLAKKHDLAVIVHGREGIDPATGGQGGRSAYEEILEILLETEISRAVFHCYGGTINTAQKIIEHGFYLGFDGPITFKKNNEQLLNVLAITPLDRVLVETDGQYLSPEPFRGMRNEPVNVALIAEKVAVVKSITREEVIEANWQNAKKLFNL
jgi:Tat protein secretion system quality control protein TatD with DNase activity